MNSRAPKDMTDDQRRAEILWTRTHKAPHGCGDTGEGPLCAQELDGTCKRPTCNYHGLDVAKA
jgi:hypothetical protein